MARRESEFLTIRSEGGLLPSDLLRRILDPAGKLDGTLPRDYGLPEGERLSEVITQSWNRLRKHWGEFRVALAGLAEGEAGTGLTNDKWSLPLLRELGFGLLPSTSGPELNGRTYAISRFFGPVPIHLVGGGLSLDRKAAGHRGAATSNPHGLVQEFLNRSPGHLWAIVGNGLRLRVLRDNQALSRQSFLEFDLAAMFDGEVYSDFVLLWLVAHATRFAPREGARPDSCWLEEWTKEAETQGTRALGDLRGGVERALQILGEGFTGHPRNARLRDALRSGELPLSDFHGQLLRVVYRLIFLFVAEDRVLDGQPLLHSRDESDAAKTARQRFAAHYGTARLRHLAGSIKGSRHGDLWRQFQLLVGALSDETAFEAVRANLALPSLGSFLWSPDSTSVLNSAELTNYDVLEALRHLAFTRKGTGLRPVDFRNLGAEELGGVYETLLALTPQVSADGARFTFAEFAGNERKTSGSYYTPDSLVQCLLDSALDPVVEEAIRGKSGLEAERAILSLKVCDPAVGSGHFLVGAAHRLARHLARARALAGGENEPSPPTYQHALRDVIGRCLYGVDINPMAAELCRVSLWLEALEPGRPLSFLDHHIRVGNSLLGTTPELIARGVPDEAFTPIEGDDKQAVSFLKKRNRAEHSGLGPLFAQQDAAALEQLQQAAAELNELPDDRPEHVRAKALAFRLREGSEEYLRKKRLADSWCAAFVMKKCFAESGRESSVSGLTQGLLTALASERTLPEDLASTVEHLATQYQFFHWHLAFPEVFARGGFDCGLGNPPWERVKLQEKEWFAERRPAIANAANAASRRSMISRLSIEDPDLWLRWLEALRRAEGESLLLRSSGRYPLCGVGRDINAAAVFAELLWSLISPRGRVGCIVPSAIGTDDTTKVFYRELTTHQSLSSFYDFENRRGLFPAVDSRMKFCLLTLTGAGSPVSEGAEFAYFLCDVSELNDADRRFRLPSGALSLLSPNTGTALVLKSRRDAALAMAMYRRTPVLLRDDGKANDRWPISTRPGHFHMSNDAELFLASRLDDDESQDDALPLYEAKMMHQFEHRWASALGSELGASERADASRGAEPRYWVSRRNVVPRRRTPEQGWHLVVRDIARSTDERTMIAAVIPECGVGGTLMLLEGVAAMAACSLLACLNSFPADYLARQRVAGVHLNPSVFRQVPVPSPSTFQVQHDWTGGIPLEEWLCPRVLELSVTSSHLVGFAGECGRPGPPFGWDEARRSDLRAELDGAMFDAYLPSDPSGGWSLAEGEPREALADLRQMFQRPRDAIAFIMDSFPIVRRKDQDKHAGEYVLKRRVLEVYDAIQDARRSQRAYRTVLEPPPGDVACRHRER